MKKLVSMIMVLAVLFVGSAFADNMYTEVESMIPEEEHPWFRIIYTMSGDPELEEAPDPYAEYTIVAYVMQENDSYYGHPAYMGIYENGKMVNLTSGYLVDEVTKETAFDTVEAIKEKASFEQINVVFGETVFYEEILK